MGITIGILGGLAAGAAGATLVTAALVGIGTALAYDYVIDSMQEDMQTDTMSGRNVSSKDAIASRKIIYGTVRTGGTIIHQAVNGTDNKYLHTIFAVCEGEVHNIDTVYADDRVLSNSLSSSPSHSGLNYNWQSPIPSLGYELVSLTGKKSIGYNISGIPDWTGNRKVQDVAYVYLKLKYDADVWTNGFPNISFLVKGKKCYNPTLDSTQTGTWRTINFPTDTHRIDDEDTWEHTQNPVICLIDYMTNTKYGLGIPFADIDVDTAKASISKCNSTDSSYFTDNQNGLNRLYLCNGIVDTKQSYKNNISNILTCMNGKLVYAAGKFHIYAYAYTAPSTDDVITEDMIIGGIDLVTKQTRRTSYNRVKGQFVSKEESYIRTDYPEQNSAYVGNSAYDITEYDDDDGEILYLDQNYPFTTSNEHAQYLARLTLLRSRMQATAKFKTNLKGLKFAVGDNVKFSNSVLGYVDKIFEIQSMRINTSASDGITIDFEIKENSPLIYDVDANTRATFTTGSTITNWDGSVPTLSNLTLESFARNSDSIIKASWTAPDTQGDVRYTVTYTPSTEGADVIKRTTFTNADELFLTVENANETYTVSVTATSLQHLTTSDPVSATVQGAGIYVQSETIVRGTSANPTTAELNSLAKAQNQEVTNGTELIYLQVDAEGVVIDSTNFVYEAVELQQALLTGRNDNHVSPTASQNYLNNTTTNAGSFTNSQDWTLSAGNAVIADGVLKFTNANSLAYAYASTLTDLEVGTTYRGEFTISNTTLAGDPVVATIYNAETNVSFSTNAFTVSDGTKSFEFTAESSRVLFVFFGSNGEPNSFHIDNAKIQKNVAKAVMTKKISLPESIDGVTYTGSVTDLGGLTDTGVTATVVNDSTGYQYTLERLSTSSGISLVLLTVTASWTSIVDGVSIPLTATKVVNLNVVVD